MIYHVGPGHAVCRGEFEGDAEDFGEQWLPEGTCDGAFITRPLVAWLRYYWYPDERKMLASGTWVEHEHRGKGLAYALWGRAMKTLKPSRVIITTVSPGGRHLVGSIVRWFPKVQFDIR